MYNGDCMEKLKAVFDAGPFIHLSEVRQLDLLSLFHRILTTHEVAEELKGLKLPEQALLTDLKPKSKDFAKYVMEKYNLDLGEATSIALCRQEQVKLFFTDDMDARETSHALGFEAHGTLAIVLRAMKEKILSKKGTIEAVEALYKKSSLFLTKDLVDWIMKEIEEFEKI